MYLREFLGGWLRGDPVAVPVCRLAGGRRDPVCPSAGWLGGRSRRDPVAVPVCRLAAAANRPELHNDLNEFRWLVSDGRICAAE